MVPKCSKLEHSVFGGILYWSSTPRKNVTIYSREKRSRGSLLKEFARHKSSWLSTFEVFSPSLYSISLRKRGRAQFPISKVRKITVGTVIERCPSSTRKKILGWRIRPEMWTFKCFSIYCPRLLCTQSLSSFFLIRNRKEGGFCPTFIWIWPLPFYSTMSPPNSQVYIFIFTLPLYISSDVSPSQPFWILGHRTDQFIHLFLQNLEKEISCCI